MHNLIVDLIFSEQDIVLAELFKAFLMETITIEDQSIKMISSCDIALNYSISLHKESLPILLITSGFYESPECMLALGQTVALDNNIYPIVFPPVDHSDLRGMLTGIQIDNIRDSSCLHPLWDIINKKIEGGNPTVWKASRRKFLQILINENVPEKKWKLTKKLNYPNPINDLRSLISYKKMNITFTHAQYALFVHPNNDLTQYVVIDIILDCSYKNNPNTLLEMHNKYIGNGIPRYPPLGLITIMAIKPGLHQFNIEIEEDKQLFFKFIEWWKPDSHQNFLDALSEAKSL